MHYTCTLRGDSLSHLEVRSITRAITINKWYPLSRYCLSARTQYTIFGASSSFPANFMITMRYYSYSAIYLREWRLNVHDEVARMKKKADYPSISIDKYRHEKLSSEHARWDRISISVSAKSMRYRIHTLHTYTDTNIHVYMHQLMDFLREITFVAKLIAKFTKQSFLTTDLFTYG